MSLTELDLLKLIFLTTETAYTIPYLAKSLQIPNKQIWDFLRTKQGRAVFHNEKHDGMIWIRPTRTGLNLIKESQNSNYEGIQDHKPARKRQHWALKQARKLATQTIDIRRISEKCQDLFSQYLEDIAIKVLHLQPDPTKNLYGPPIYLQYATRFTSVPRQIEIREKYEQIWKNSLGSYQKAVMLTLTTDPKQFRNLEEANKAIQKNWNKLITRLRKNTKKELKYICIREFQKNGRIHLHIVIFGIGYLINAKKLSKIWAGYGQGKIIDILSLVNRNQEWTWARKKPTDSGNRNPMNYLKKYISKAQTDEDVQYQYWMTESRFYTYSYSLLETIKPLLHEALYIFVGTIEADGVKTLPWSTGPYTHHIKITGR